MKNRKDKQGRRLEKGEMQRSEDLLYIYKYVDVLGKTKRIYAKTLQELREKEQQIKRDQMDGLDVYVAGDADLNYVFDRYISTKTELRKTTMTNYMYMYDKFVRDSFGKLKVRSIVFSQVVAFYKQLHDVQGLEYATVDTINTMLHPAFDMAVRDNIIRNNPSYGAMKDIKKKFGKNKGIRNALTAEQQKAFLTYVRESKVHWRWDNLFTVLFGTGLRISECVGLRWEDIDLDNKIINVNHQAVYFARKPPHFEISLPKTDQGIRVVPMMPKVYEAFKSEYEWQSEHGFCTSEIDGMSGFIFCNRFGTIHIPQTINRAIHRIVDNYNAEEEVNAKKEKREPVLIPQFSCHTCRHTFCSRLCEVETNIKKIQMIMGHKDISTTMDIYAEVSDASKTESIENLAELCYNIF